MEELYGKLSSSKRRSWAITNQRIVFPDPAENVEGDEGPIGEEWEERTFAIDPQERARRFPFSKHTAFEEPLGTSSVVNIARNVVIC